MHLIVKSHNSYASTADWWGNISLFRAVAPAEPANFLWVGVTRSAQRLGRDGCNLRAAHSRPRRLHKAARCVKRLVIRWWSGAASFTRVPGPHCGRPGQPLGGPAAPRCRSALGIRRSARRHATGAGQRRPRARWAVRTSRPGSIKQIASMTDGRASTHCD